LQGPHHSAQKSTNTGLSDCRTSAVKSLSVVFDVAIMIPFHRKNLRRMCRCLRGFKFMVWLLPRQAWRHEYLSN
jgi:hypothetical protein